MDYAAAIGSQRSPRYHQHDCSEHSCDDHAGSQRLSKIVVRSQLPIVASDSDQKVEYVQRLYSSWPRMRDFVDHHKQTVKNKSNDTSIFVAVKNPPPARLTAVASANPMEAQGQAQEEYWPVTCHQLSVPFGIDNSPIVALTKEIQTQGILPKNPMSPLIEPDPDMLRRAVLDGESIEIDTQNHDIDICYLPNRKGTRSPQQKPSCFICEPEEKRVYWVKGEVAATHNIKPYADATHYLKCPVDHEPQVYSADMFADCLKEVNDAAEVKRQASEKPHRTGLFAGPIGGSQSHQHWHMISKNMRVQKAVEDPSNLRPIAFDGDDNNGIYWVKSKPIDVKAEDGASKPMSFFNCLMIRGKESFLRNWAEKVVNHFGKVNPKTGLPRALYNMAVLPPDDQNRGRLIIFPRSPDPKNDNLKNELLWGAGSFNPSAHEMAGHWYMTDLPKNPNPEQSQEQFYRQLTEEIYKVANEISVPFEELALDKLFHKTVTLHTSPAVMEKPELSTPEHLAVEWHGWGALMDPQSQPSTSGLKQPVLFSYTAPQDTDGLDTDYINPVLTQRQINDLYDLLEQTHEVLSDAQIPYVAGAGTLMGAVRNGGQMWNDGDADFFVREQDAQKIQDLEEQFNEMGLQIKKNWSGYQVSKLTHPAGRQSKGVPFLELLLMKPKLTQNHEPIWEFVNSPSARGDKKGATILHQLSGQAFNNDQRKEIRFGLSAESDGFDGVKIMVPSEKDSIRYLNQAYGDQWFSVLKTHTRDHVADKPIRKTLSLSMVNRGHVIRKNGLPMNNSSVVSLASLRSQASVCSLTADTQNTNIEKLH